jgi:glycosyltransferase involved in cell wall biosynthesis
MKLPANVLHVPYCYAPDPMGGTEVYVQSLAEGLSRRGIRSSIAAPGKHDESYESGGLSVHRYALDSAAPALETIYGAGDAVAAAGFARMLDRLQPELVHLHAFTSGVSLRIMRVVRERGLPLLFTFHTPTVLCLRGTLLEGGTLLCDGVVSPSRCATCMLQKLGAPATAATLLGHMPLPDALLRHLPGKLATAARMNSLAALQQQTAREALTLPHHIVAVADWVKDVLLRNGVPSERVSVSRQGLPWLSAADTPPPRNEAVKRLAFLGRMDATKGVEVILAAMQAAPELALELDIYAIAQDDAARAVLASLQQRYAADARIRFLAPVPAAQVATMLRGYDVLVVPSQWLETGPLVVYEAFGAGIPILGSDLGGIAELVRHDHDGLLVPMSDISAWTAALRRMATEAALLPRLRSNVRPPRTMDDAAADMLPLYARALQQAAVGMELLPR